MTVHNYATNDDLPPFGQPQSSTCRKEHWSLEHDALCQAKSVYGSGVVPSYICWFSSGGTIVIESVAAWAELGCALSVRSGWKCLSPAAAFMTTEIHHERLASYL